MAVDSSTGQERQEGEGEGADALLFEGNAALLELLRQQFPRPPRRGLSRPLICLVHDSPAAVLPALQATGRISGLVACEPLTPDSANPPPQTPFPAPTVRDVEKTLDLLKKLAKELGGLPGGIKRFRRFGLVAWLMTRRIPEQEADPAERAEQVRGWLRTRDRYRLADVPNDLGIPGWLRAALITGARLAYRARISGRVPLLSGYYRWFLRRESLAPEYAGGLPSVATELTDRVWQKDPERTLLCLVNAFMEDIRTHYRSPARRFFGVAPTSCCTLLISNITRRNGGYHLVRAINEVRNRTGLADPLLVVTESQRVPPFARVPVGERPVAEAASAMTWWTAQILAAQHNREDAAWFLPLTVPPAPEGARNAQRRDLAGAGLIEAPRESRLQIGLRVGAAAVVLLGAVGGYAGWSAAHCGNGVSWPGFDPTMSWVGGECVGVSTELTDLLQPLDPQTRQLAATVEDLNHQVDQQHALQPERPVFTLVYLGALGAPGPNTGALAAEVEGLKGVAVAQRRQLNIFGSTDPLVKVITANAGQRMSSGPEVADVIGAVARRDPSVVGAVGLNESYQVTADTVKRLASQGIPIIAATASVDDFATDLPLYFQIAPQDKREAAVAAAYATRNPPPARSVRIYFSDDAADVYSANLTQDVRDAFRRAGFTPETVSFTPDGARPPANPAQADRHVPSARDAGVDACNFPGLVFYAGRPAPDFGSFLGQVPNCQPKQPRILADDDITRYVADDLARHQYPSVPFDYLAFAVTPQAQGKATPEIDFYSSYDKLFPAQPNAALDGHAALAYDAAETYVAAVQALRSGAAAVPITPGTVWGQISSLRGMRGASGYIDFGRQGDRHVPIDKPILVLHVVNGEVQASTESYCGPPPAQDPRTQPWCPHESPAG